MLNDPMPRSVHQRRFWALLGSTLTDKAATTVTNPIAMTRM
jgi:hypothetical protein